MFNCPVSACWLIDCALAHFTKDCPTSREEKEIEPLQQMLNLEGEQTSLKSLVENTFQTGTYMLI